VEEARQVIASQRELLKLNYENTTKKVSDLEKALTGNRMSERKRKGLTKKLEKRKRKQAYYENLIETNTIPPVVFGTKEMFYRRCKGLISQEEWQAARNNRIHSRGDKTKSGNPNLRVIVSERGYVFLEISTLERTSSNRALKLLTPLYLPQKVSKKTGMVNGIDYKSMMFEYLRTGEAYKVELIKREGRYHCHITIESGKLQSHGACYTGSSKLIGVDTNPDGLALTLIKKDGNYLDSMYLKEPQLKDARSSRRENLCGELSQKVVEYAKAQGCGLVIEDLKFADDRDVGTKFARVKHQFVYSKLLRMLEAACLRNNIEVIKVKPQYTSKIGLYKYCHQYGIDVHNGAALVIARRGYGYKERVPKLLKDNLVKNRASFDKKTEWGKWSEVTKTIEKEMKNTKTKGGTGFWERDRKMVLGLVEK
jgi:IS605 OrfB family transposase